MNKKFKLSSKTIARTALMTALVTVSTMLGINIATGYVNMGETMIFITAYLFGPIPALIAGGLGSFFADMIVYPTTMVFTLFIKGGEGLVCGLLFRYIFKANTNKALNIGFSALLMLVSSLIMIFGYFFMQWLLWGTRASALAQLPWDCLQAGVAIVVANALIFGVKLGDLVNGKNKTVPHCSISDDELVPKDK